MTRQTFELEIDDGWLRTRLVALGADDRRDGAYLATLLAAVIDHHTTLRVVRCEHVGQASDVDTCRPRPEPLPGYEHLVGHGT